LVFSPYFLLHNNTSMARYYFNKLGLAITAVCALFGSVITSAGQTEPSQAEESAQSDPSGNAEAIEGGTTSLEGSITIEDRMRLHRDLNEYSRTVDPSHIVIEEHRRGMRQRLHERFTGSDKDSDGSISREEAAETLPQIARHFNQVDANGDGVVTLNELAVVHAKMVERRQPSTAKSDVQEVQEVELAKRKSKDSAARKKSL
jgi:hypothetical protein